MTTTKKIDVEMHSYEVFGRDHAERPLQHLGTVQGANRNVAVAHARFVYSERQWVELCLSPTASFSGCLHAGTDGRVGVA